MKDQDVRDRLGKFEAYIEGSCIALEKRLNLSLEHIIAGQVRLKWLWDVSIKDCPNCKHPALAKWDNSDLLSKDGECIFASGYNQCLSCGTKFTCSAKGVCEIIKDSDVSD